MVLKRLVHLFSIVAVVSVVLYVYLTGTVQNHMMIASTSTKHLSFAPVASKKYQLETESTEDSETKRVEAIATTTTTKTATKTSNITQPTTTEAVTAVPRPIHDLSAEEPYRRRVVNIRDQCARKKPPSNFVWANKKSFKYVDEARLVMCETPKVASTTWQLLLLRLGGFKGNFTKELLRKWDYSIIPNKHFLNMKNQTEIWRRMKNYTKFLITRHPFERLVSSYYDKLSNRSTYGYYRAEVGTKIARNQAADYMHGIGLKPGKKIDEQAIIASEQFKLLTREQQENVRKYIQVLKTGEVSFHQFAKSLIQTFHAGRTAQLDIHWRPQVMLCHPCQFDYSYVMKFENLAEDSNRLLDYVQTKTMNSSALTDKLTFPSKTKPATKNSITQSTMQQISEELVEELRKLYADDFLLYDYDPHLFTGY